jgi:hypothetical protein
VNRVDQSLSVHRIRRDVVAIAIGVVPTFLSADRF